MSSTFNPSMLLLARQYRGETQQEVAAKSALHQSHYSRLENGFLSGRVSTKSIRAVAQALRFPTGFFYLSDELAGSALSVHPMARRKAALSVTTVRRALAETNLRLIHLRRLLRSIDLKEELPLPWYESFENDGPDTVAQLLRRSWHIPDGPFPNLAQYCERAGIMVIWSDLIPGLDGLTIRTNDLPPCVFLNRRAPADRMRFTLAHELGHIVMHRVATDEIEKEANRFAGELLVPRQDLIPQVIGNRVTLHFLARLKAYWRTSMQVLLFRIGEEGLITQRQQSYLWKQFAVNGWKIQEPAQTKIEHERPYLLRHIIQLHQQDLDYKVNDLGRLLRLGTTDLYSLYGEELIKPRPAHLRVVS